MLKVTSKGRGETHLSKIKAHLSQQHNTAMQTLRKANTVGKHCLIWRASRVCLWGRNLAFAGTVVLLQCPAHMAEAEQITCLIILGQCYQVKHGICSQDNSNKPWVNTRLFSFPSLSPLPPPGRSSTPHLTDGISCKIHVWVPPAT